MVVQQQKYWQVLSYLVQSPGAKGYIHPNDLNAASVPALFVLSYFRSVPQSLFSGCDLVVVHQAFESLPKLIFASVGNLEEEIRLIVLRKARPRGRD